VTVERPPRGQSDLASLCEPVARIVWCEPSSETATELRWGTHGSRVVDRTRGVWFDHERDVGGGTLDLVPGATKADRLQWLRDHSLINKAPSGPRKKRTGGRAPFTIIATYDYTDESGVLLFQVVRLAPKDFRQRRPNGTGGWTWRLGKTRRVLYRLPEVREAAASGRLVVIVEGEKDTDNLRKLGFTTTCNPGGANKWRAEYNESLRDADVLIIGDNDDSGRAHVAQVASSLEGVARRVRVLDLAKAWPECPAKGDISDWIEIGGTAEALNALIEALPEWTPGPNAAGDGADRCDGEAKIAALAGLGEFAYQRCRVSEAKALGVPVAALDKLVRRCRGVAEKKVAALPHWHVDAWNTAISGAELLDSIEKVFRRYIVLPKGEAEALALWTLHAWTADAGDISPFMVLVSPTKRCGKTSALIILYYLTPRSELASNISASAVFRYIQDTRPTLLIDEADTFVRDNEQMRGILNSGHTKAAAHVIRNVEINGEHKPQRFSTWAPKAIATIRELADTLEDRAIIVTLQRKPKAAVVARLRKRDSDEFATLRRQAARWAADNFEKLTDPDPDVPEVLNDRAADNWRPLLAIADLAGSRWPQRAREAACLLSGEGHESSSINVELLANIKKAFGDKEAMASADLVAALVANPEWPWAEWTRGRPLTQRQLARLLKPFFIIPQTVHIHGFKDAKGYSRIALAEAWAAYLPGQDASSHQFRPFDPSKRPNPDGMGTSCNFRSVQSAAPDGSKNSNLSNSHAGLDAWTDRKAGNGVKGHSGQEIAPDPTDPGPIPEFLLRTAPRPCDYCGSMLGAMNPWDWPGRPDGIWLHPRCEAGWMNSGAGRDPR
jgi:Protein of unknown function (DUF3631)